MTLTKTHPLLFVCLLITPHLGLSACQRKWRDSQKKKNVCLCLQFGSTCRFTEGKEKLMYVGPSQSDINRQPQKKTLTLAEPWRPSQYDIGLFFFFHDTFDDCFQMDPSLSIWATRAFHFSLRQTKSIGSRTPTHAASGIAHPGTALKMQQAFPKADERPSCLALQFLQGPFQIHVGFFF